MRVITGTARGKKLITPMGDKVRPTTDKVKESMFNIIQFEIEGAQVLDLYSGCGQLGIEALSRGASQCTFVDNNRDSLDALRKNIANTGFSASAKIVPQDAVTFASTTTAKFDVIILDPPYNSETTPDVLMKLSAHMRDNGVIICETAKGEVLPQELSGYSLYKEYAYGSIKLTAYRQLSEEVE